MNETKYRTSRLGAQKTIVQWAKSASEFFEKEWHAICSSKL
jgi:hypothetical protein